MGGIFSKVWPRTTTSQEEYVQHFDPETGLITTFEPGSSEDVYNYGDVWGHDVSVPSASMVDFDNPFTRRTRTPSTSSDEFGVDQIEETPFEPQEEKGEEKNELAPHPHIPLIPLNVGWLKFTGRRPFFSASRVGGQAGLPSCCPYIDTQPPETFGFLYTNSLTQSKSSHDMRTGFVFCDNRAGIALSELADKRRPKNPSYAAVTLPGVLISVNKTGAGTVHINQLDMTDPRGVVNSQYVNIWPRSRVTGDAYCVCWFDYVTAFSTDDSVVIVGNNNYDGDAGVSLLFITFVADTQAQQLKAGTIPYPWRAKVHDFSFSPLQYDTTLDRDYCTKAKVVYAVPVQAWMRPGAGPVLIRSEGWVLVFMEHSSSDTVARPRYFSAWLISSRNRNLSMGVVDLDANSPSLLIHIHHLLTSKSALHVEATAFVSASSKVIPLPYCRILIKFADEAHEGAFLSEDTTAFQLEYAPVGTVDRVVQLSRMSNKIPTGAAYPRLGDAGMCAAGAWDVQVELRPNGDDISCIRIYLKDSQGFSTQGAVIAIGGSGVVRVDLHKSTNRPGTLVFVIFSEHTVCTQEGNSAAVPVMSFIVLIVDVPTGFRWAFSPLGTRPKADMLASLISSDIPYMSSCEDAGGDLYERVTRESQFTPHLPRMPMLDTPVILYKSKCPPPPRPSPPREAMTVHTASETSTESTQGNDDGDEVVYEYEYGSGSYRDEQQETTSDTGGEAGPSRPTTRSSIPPGLVPINVLLFEQQAAVVLANHVLNARLCSPWDGETEADIYTTVSSSAEIFFNSRMSDNPRFLAGAYYTCPAQGEPFSGTFSVLMLDGDTKVLGVVALGEPDLH